MRLYLAIAVLMLALVAYTEAQEETIEQKITKFTESLKASFDDFQTSDIAVNSKARFDEFIEWMKTKFQ